MYKLGKKREVVNQNTVKCLGCGQMFFPNPMYKGKKHKCTKCKTREKQPPISHVNVKPIIKLEKNGNTLPTNTQKKEKEPVYYKPIRPVPKTRNLSDSKWDELKAFAKKLKGD